MKSDPEFVELDQLLEQIQCFCGSYPRLFQETLFSEPPIVTFFYECRCGRKTGNFYNSIEARKCWRRRHSRHLMDPCIWE